MEFFELVKKRRSIRSFDPQKPVSEEQIAKILEAGIWAPSAGNLQDWFFVVVRDQKVKDQLAQAALGQDFVAEAPVVIVVCCDLERISHYGKRGQELYTFQDTACAAQNMFLAATDLDLGACWVGAFDEKKVIQILNLADHLRPVAILPIGYPAEKPSPPSRRKIEEVSKEI